MTRLSKEDLCVIKICFEEKGRRGARMVREFPNKYWSRRIIERAIKRFETTGAFDDEKHRTIRTVTTATNQEAVETVLLSQQKQPGSHLSHRHAARCMG